MANGFLIRVSKLFNGERIVCLTNQAGTTEDSHKKECSWTPTSHHIQKLTQSGPKT